MSATTETSVGSISGVFDDNAFEQIGDVFTPVRGRLEEVENLLPLDDRDRVAFLIEELDDGVLMDAIGLVFELLDAGSRFEDAVVAAFKSVQCVRDAVERLAGNLDQAFRARADDHDSI